MGRGAMLGLGIVVGVAAAWLGGLAFGPFDATSSDAPDEELGAAVRRLERQNAALQRQAAERPPTLAARPGVPAPPRPKAAPAASPAPQDIFQRWRRSPSVPADIPKALRGKPAMWIEAMRMADQAGQSSHAHFFMMALIAVGPEAVAPLRTVLMDTGEGATLRAHALTALQSLAPKQIGDLAAGLVESEPAGTKLRAQALQALASARPDRVARSVVDIAYDPDAPRRERIPAMTAVMHAEPTEAEALFRRTLRDGTEAERDLVYRVLPQAYRPELQPYIREALAGAPPKRQRNLIQALARMKGPGWGNEQMTGAPDTPVGGDNVTAWASKQGEEGLVWVELDFPVEVTPEQVRVHETFNAGAIVKLEARRPGGGWTVLWTGPARPTGAPRWFVPPLAQTGDRTSTVRLTLDTDKVKGWNEIDAVELVGEGRGQWASAARSSSCYANRGS